MVTAIVRQSMRATDSMAIAERAIGARLMAMASAHDLLLRANWKTTRLTAVVFGAVEHHIESPGRIVLQGDQIEILAAAVVPLTLVLNELYTNAAKYGALSMTDAGPFRDGEGGPPQNLCGRACRCGSMQTPETGWPDRAEG